MNYEVAKSLGLYEQHLENGYMHTCVYTSRSTQDEKKHLLLIFIEQSFQYTIFLLYINKLFIVYEYSYKYSLFVSIVLYVVG